MTLWAYALAANSQLVPCDCSMHHELTTVLAVALEP